MEIYEVTPIVNEEHRGRPKGAVAKIREIHHTVARLTAKGFKPTQIGPLLNRTPATIRNWLGTPAMTELVAQYSGEHEIEITNELEYRTKLALETLTLALENVRDTLRDDPDKVPMSLQHKIIADLSDRTGFARQETKVNLNMDMGTKLDQAWERSQAAKVETSPAVKNVVKLIRRA